MPTRPWTPIIDPEALKTARLSLGLTQRDLADKVTAHGTKLDRGNIYRAEHGKPGSIGVRKLPAVAHVLGKNVTELLTEYGRCSLALTTPAAEALLNAQSP